MISEPSIEGWILFDWGGTLMRDFPEYKGPMAGWPKVEPLPHAETVLPILRSRWRLALATNAADSDENAIRAALRRGGLSPLIDKIFCFRNLGHRKPSREFFERIMESLCIDCSGLVMVGDDFETDCMGANRSGIRAVWLNETGSETRRGNMLRTIHRLPDLPRVLGERLFREEAPPCGSAAPEEPATPLNR